MNSSTRPRTSVEKTTTVACALAFVAVAFSLVGCQGTYHARYAFDPVPAEVLTPRPAVDGEPAGTVARTLATVIGVRRIAQGIEHPNTVEVRMRLENFGPEPISMDTTAMSLFSGDLQIFPAPFVVPGGRIDLRAGEDAMINAFFPLPGADTPNDLDLSGLNLRWTIERAGEPVTESISFRQRRYPYRLNHWHYPGGYWGSGWGWRAGFGYYWCD